MRLLQLILVLLCGPGAYAAEVIPPAPARYFNDYAKVTSSSVAEQLNQALENFERQTSDQIVVAVFPKMQSDSSVEDYTVRVARAWRAGQAKLNNGAVLFVFVQDHKLYIQVGYGLEGALPDALCKRIIDEQITPRFRSGDFNGGLTAGVNALMSAARGEYQGNGRTVADATHRPKQSHFGPLILVVIVVILAVLFGRRRRWGGYSGGWTFGSGGFFGGGWGGGWGGGGSSGGGGGFSGGGGSFGGGGAGGSW